MNEDYKQFETVTDSDKDVLPDVIVSKQERENGIDGIDAKILLEQMRKIVSEAESK